MGQVGVNNEPLLERALFGFDGTLWQPVKLNSSGVLYVGFATEQNIQSRGYGQIGNSWYKQPLELGYESTASEQIATTNATAGTNLLTGTAITQSEVWVIKNCSTVNSNNASTVIYLQAVIGGVTVTFFRQAPGVAGVWYYTNCDIVLGYGDYVKCYHYGCVAGDDLYFNYSGYKFTIRT